MTVDWKPSVPSGAWPGCAGCRRFDRRRRRCDAYPRAIPIPIASGEVDHLVPRPGDGGLIFAPIEPANAAD